MTPVLVALAVSFVATPLLARAALAFAWVDRREGEEHRKPREKPVPLVGGAALLLAIGAWDLAGGESGSGLPWPALLAAFSVGAVDDLRKGGLPPWAKLAGQALAALLFAAEPGLTVGERVLAFSVAVVAQNALNTFDNVDGAAAGLCLAALWPAPGARAALAGFLPWNLVVRRGRVPVAYLGDSGSHALGILVAATPGAVAFLALPLLDLARLARLRLARGSKPWVGDRRHVAHRLEVAGLGSIAVVGTLLVLASPALVSRAVAPGTVGTVLATVATLVLLVVAVARTPDPDRPRDPVDGPGVPGE